MADELKETKPKTKFSCLTRILETVLEYPGTFIQYINNTFKFIQTLIVSDPQRKQSQEIRQKNLVEYHKKWKIYVEYIDTLVANELMHSICVRY